MRERASQLIDELDEHPPPVDPGEIEEVKSFLRWVAEDHFTFLGYREYDLVDRSRRRGPAGTSGLRAGDPPAAAGAPVQPPRARRRSELALAPHQPRPHQGQLALDRPPPGVPRLHRRQAVLARGRGDRRAALPRPLHVHGLPREPARDPVPAQQGQARARAGRVPAGQPRPQGADRDPRVLPARLAVPDRQRRAVRDRDGDPRARGAPAGAAVRPARSARPVRRVPGARFRATGSTPRTANASPRSCSRRSAAATWTGRCSCRSRCSRACCT